MSCHGSWPPSTCWLSSDTCSPLMSEYSSTELKNSAICAANIGVYVSAPSLTARSPPLDCLAGVSDAPPDRISLSSSIRC